MEYVIHWFRRDLRLYDNHALHQAIQSGLRVKCIFIFDTFILSQLPKTDRRVQFIYNQLCKIKKELKHKGADLYVYHDKPLEVFKEIIKDKNLKAVFANRDYEPYAIQRDKTIFEALQPHGIPFKGYKDQVIFDKEDIFSLEGKPYTVYTPYKNKWKSTLATNPDALIEKHIHLEKANLYTTEDAVWLRMADLGFEEVRLPALPTALNDIQIKDYDKTRDIPASDATTKLGTALRFGTISIRQLVSYAQEKNETFLDELIWREFFMQILYHYPHVQNRAFRPKYEGIAWRNNEEEFKLWCEGKTGFPIVDAGMRELNQTGFMHNRVRMITASFLVKDLLIDWRWGEAYFARKLIDYDLAANNGNWQWAAGTGTDAAPYFRIFNPYTQQKKFDPDLAYVLKWIPEYGTEAYPEEIVNHKEARDRYLMAYKKAIQDYES